MFVYSSLWIESSKSDKIKTIRQGKKCSKTINKKEVMK